MTVVRFPISLQRHASQWDATAYDLGQCVHDDCKSPAVFFLEHRPGREPSITFVTGERAQRLKRFHEQDNDFVLVPSPAPLVCGGCAHGALAALIAYGN